MSAPTPPQYILVSQSSLLSNSQPESHSTVISHPQIHYQYADDAPTTIPTLLPSNARILYLDVDPANPSHAQARSSSDTIISTGVTVSDAVGASPSENPHMYVVSAVGLQPSNPSRDDPKLILSDYRERLNATRQVIKSDAPNPGVDPETQTKLFHGTS